MMIKLFLITLLCATLVFADLPIQDFQDAWEKPVNGFVSMVDRFMGRGGSSLVRRSAQESPRGPSPIAADLGYEEYAKYGEYGGGYGGGYGGFGGQAGFGFTIGGGIGGGMGGGMGGGGGGEAEGGE